WLMMSLWDALRMNMMISYQELVRTFPCVSDNKHSFKTFRNNQNTGIPLVNIFTYEMNKYWNI
ncbi:hypothetical protein, partial [Escherichia coli]|uniref:hypothetical protein n=1 Tax=Escherichia coli TaxID=562 RepID=UPI001BC8A357